MMKNEEERLRHEMDVMKTRWVPYDFPREPKTDHVKYTGYIVIILGALIILPIIYLWGISL